MPIDPSAAHTTGEPGEFSWTSADALLYALAVGAGVSDPTGAELEFTTENSHDVTQRVLPTMAVTLGARSGTRPTYGDFDWAKLVHGEQSVVVHRPIPVEGTAVNTPTVGGIYDKGRAALVEIGNEVTIDGEPLFTTTGSLFIHGEGGWGGDSGPKVDWTPPEGSPDATVGFDTRADQALLYRLTGDRNPLHSDPWFADRAGFDRPILHGLCTFGVTGRLLLLEVLGGDTDRFAGMAGRFSAPVFPGQRLDVDIWDDGSGQALFRTRVGDAVVLDRGTLDYRT